MTTVHIQFQKVIMDEEDVGTGNDHMISRVFFRIGPAGKMVDSFATIKQIPGGREAIAIEAHPPSLYDGPMEVSRPSNYKGPLAFEAYRDLVERYYRAAVLGTIKMTGTGRLRNNAFATPMSGTFDVEDRGTGW